MSDPTPGAQIGPIKASMFREDVVDLIVACFRESLPPDSIPPSASEQTRIFGRGGFLDSMQLVNLLMEIEQRVNERWRTSISIADDRAMSQERSPFRTIASLSDYVAMLMAEQTLLPENLNSTTPSL
jgi:acyl carrier protein